MISQGRSEMLVWISWAVAVGGLALLTLVVKPCGKFRHNPYRHISVLPRPSSTHSFFSLRDADSLKCLELSGLAHGCSGDKYIRFGHSGVISNYHDLAFLLFCCWVQAR